MNEAFFFSGDSGSNLQLFGTATRAELKDKASFGVLICPAFSEERQKTYRSTFLFSKALAEAGISSMRFDYSGTGDSEGVLADTSIDSMVRDTVFAHDRAKACLDVERLVLLGVRLGAAIAMMAANTIGDIEKLVLWNPVTNGKRFFRDLTRTEAMINLARKKTTDAHVNDISRGIEVDADFLSDRFVSQLKEDDMLTLQHPGAKYLLTGQIADKIEQKQLEKLAQSLRESGKQVDSWAQETMEFWSSRSMYDAFYPTQTFSRTIDWLSEE